jgi:hypothetical protein
LLPPPPHVPHAVMLPGPFTIDCAIILFVWMLVVMDIMCCVSNMSFIMAKIGLRRTKQKTKQEVLSMIIPISHRNCSCWIYIQPHNQTVKTLQSCGYITIAHGCYCSFFSEWQFYGTQGPGMTVHSGHSTYICVSIYLNSECMRSIINFSAFRNHVLSTIT